MYENREKLMEFIISHIEANMRPPTIREAMDHLGLTSPNGVMCHVNALVRDGRIKRDEKHSCGLIPAGYKCKLVPIMVAPMSTSAAATMQVSP